MAQIHEELLAIKLSKLLKDGDTQELIIGEDLKQTLLGILEQFLGEIDSKLLIEVVDLGE
jgi:hypothetical protein